MKKYTEKLLALLLALLMVVGLAACNSPSETDTADGPTTSTQPADTTTPEDTEPEPADVPSISVT